MERERLRSAGGDQGSVTESAREPCPIRARELSPRFPPPVLPGAVVGNRRGAGASSGWLSKIVSALVAVGEQRLAPAKAHETANTNEHDGAW